MTSDAKALLIAQRNQALEDLEQTLERVHVVEIMHRIENANQRQQGNVNVNHSIPTHSTPTQHRLTTTLMMPDHASTSDHLRSAAQTDGKSDDGDAAVRSCCRLVHARH